MLIDFQDEQFETKIKNEDVSIVQFSAEWCQPCSGGRGRGRGRAARLGEVAQADAMAASGALPGAHRSQVDEHAARASR